LGRQQLRDFTDVDDAVDAVPAHRADAQSDGKVYNLGGSEVIDLASLAKLLVEVNGGGTFEVREFPAERHKIDIGDYYSDFAKIESDLGWKPQRSLRETIERTVAFYREHLAAYL
jgi:nucleoside-diphosphate-sugar epimerase